MAQSATPGADQAFDATKEVVGRVAEQGRRAADQAGEVARELPDRSEDAVRQGLHVVQREVVRHTVDGTAALGRTLVDLTVAQARQNFETLAALTGAIDWGQVAEAVDWERVMRVQSEHHLRLSLERTAELTQRYLELSQAVLTATASVAERQAKRAA